MVRVSEVVNGSTWVADPLGMVPRRGKKQAGRLREGIECCLFRRALTHTVQVDVRYEDFCSDKASP